MSHPRKVEIELDSASRLLHPRNTVLVTCRGKRNKVDIITLAWSMPVSHKPSMAAISIAPRRLSHRIIQQTGEFVINVPTMDIVRQTLFCGRVSGRTHDKFKEAHFTRLPAKRVRVPLIKECAAHLECMVRKKVIVGDHTLFIGEVVACSVNEGIFDKEFKIDKMKPVFHIGGDDFATLSDKVVSPPSPKKRRE